jgi:hypothetical protein
MGDTESDNGRSGEDDVLVQQISEDDADEAVRRIEREVAPYFREGGRLATANGASRVRDSKRS